MREHEAFLKEEANAKNLSNLSDYNDRHGYQQSLPLGHPFRLELFWNPLAFLLDVHEEHGYQFPVPIDLHLMSAVERGIGMDLIQDHDLSAGWKLNRNSVVRSVRDGCDSSRLESESLFKHSPFLKPEAKPHARNAGHTSAFKKSDEM